MRPDQLDLITTVDAPALAPDGRRLVVGTARTDLATDGYTGQLWVVTTDGSAPPRRLTRGYRDAAARLSPDGSMVAFLRSPAPGGDPSESSAPQLALIPLDGGEARLLTDRRLGVGGFNWSPDARWIVFASADPETGRYGTVSGVGPAQEDPRRVTGPDHRMDGRGYTADQPSCLFEIEVPDPDGEPVFPARGRMADAAGRSPLVPPARRLTGRDRESTDPVYAADSRHVFFTTTPATGFGRDLRRAVAVVESRADETTETAETAETAQGQTHDAGPIRLVAGGTAVPCGFHSPCASRNGEWLYLLGEELGESGLDFVAANAAVFAVPARAAMHEATVGWERPAPAVVPRRLTDPETMDCSGGPLHPSGQDNVLALAEARGQTVLVWMSHHGQPEVLVEQPGEIVGASEAGGTLTVSYTTEDSPGRVGVQQRGAGLVEVFDPNRSWLAEQRLAGGREREYGQPSVHGWVFVPPGPGPHPVILNIHGGPYAQYTWSWFDETQVLVAAGYAVVMCNPRGSNGYGAAHGAALRGRFGTVDRQDILGFLEGALAEFGPAGTGELDGDRLGVQGGSYGGFMTAWITAHDHRFTAAIVERGYLDPVSALGSSDIGWFFSPQYMGSSPEDLYRQSPLHHVDQVDTPTLVMHSEQDLRCPLEHAQRYYHALWSRGVESELVVFPGEGHELSRSGTPWHRRARFEHILRWWDRHLAR